MTAMLVAVFWCAQPAGASPSFWPAPGSPYAATSPAFTPNSGGILGGATTGDFNHDGISDVAVVVASGLPVFSAGESVAVLLGSRASGLSFAPGSPVAIYSGGNMSGSGPIASGDFNGDGNTDLAVVNAIDNTVTILLGDGHGGFRLGAPTPFSGWGGASALAVGDFNGDGRLDVAVVNEKLNVLLGNGAGGLSQAPGSPPTLPAFGLSAVAGAFTGDGHTALAVVDSSGHISVYSGNAAGEMTAVAQSSLNPSSGYGEMTSADFNRDGRLDLAVVNGSDDDVAVLLGDGRGSFTPVSGSPFPVPGAASSSQPGLPQSVAAGDFTCNDVVDLAIANFNGSSDNVAVLEGDGRGVFTSPIGSVFPANGNPRPTMAGDFNGDGKPDIAVVNSFQGRITVLENTTGASECQAPPVIMPPFTPPTETPPARASETPWIESVTLARHRIRVGRPVSLTVKLHASGTVVVRFEKTAFTVLGHRRILRFVGALALEGHAGANTFRIGRIHGHWLTPGRYTLVVFSESGTVRTAERTLSLTVRR